MVSSHMSFPSTISLGEFYTGLVWLVRTEGDQGWKGGLMEGALDGSRGILLSFAFSVCHMCPTCLPILFALCSGSWAAPVVSMLAHQCSAQLFQPQCPVPKEQEWVDQAWMGT